MQITKNLSLTFVLLISISHFPSLLNAIPISNWSKIKVAAGTGIGCLVVALPTLLAKCYYDWTIIEKKKYGEHESTKLFYYGYIGINWKKAALLGVATVVASVAGGCLTYYFLTPEGKISRARSSIKSVNTNLLKLIEESKTTEMFLEKIKWFYKSTAFPSIMAFEYLDKWRADLLSKQEMLEKMQNKIEEYSQLEQEIEELLENITNLVLLMERGIDLIKGDPSFDVKWQAYMLEKRLREMEDQLRQTKNELFFHNIQHIMC